MLICVGGKQSKMESNWLFLEVTGAELMDELKPQSHIRLDSKLLLSGNLQQIGSMEWIIYKPRWGSIL